MPLLLLLKFLSDNLVNSVFFIATFVPVPKISDPWFKFFKKSLHDCYCHLMEIR